MSNETLLAAVDAEIRKLEETRRLLGGIAAPAGRAAPAKKVATGGKRRKLSTERRARIAEAQRKRWAAKKRAEKKSASDIARQLSPSAYTRKCPALPHLTPLFQYRRLVMAAVALVWSLTPRCASRSRRIGQRVVCPFLGNLRTARSADPGR